MTTNSIQNEGAELTYDVQGKGEPMILIPGAGGDAFGYRKLAPILAEHFIVITMIGAAGLAAPEIRLRRST